MRTMPKVIHADPYTGAGKGIDVPTISREEFHRRLAEIAGRPLTADETTRADKMGDHNWTLRIVASELFGEAVADRHFAPKD